MKKSIIVKGLTLTCFATLLVSFILYRTGQFDGYFYHEQRAAYTSPNGGVIVTGKDSTKSKKNTLDMSNLVSYGGSESPDTSGSRTRMASSKSMIMIEDTTLLKRLLQGVDSMNKSKEKSKEKVKQKK